MTAAFLRSPRLPRPCSGSFWFHPSGHCAPRFLCSPLLRSLAERFPTHSPSTIRTSIRNPTPLSSPPSPSPPPLMLHVCAQLWHHYAAVGERPTKLLPTQIVLIKDDTQPIPSPCVAIAHNRQPQALCRRPSMRAPPGDPARASGRTGMREASTQLTAHDCSSTSLSQSFSGEVRLSGADEA